MGYQEDLVLALKKETDLIKKQTMLEVISVVTSCDTYEEFKRAMYGMAIQYFREMETEGLVKPGTVDKLLNDSNKKEEPSDEGILL
jgi:hypothetical protein